MFGFFKNLNDTTKCYICNHMHFKIIKYTIFKKHGVVLPNLIKNQIPGMTKLLLTLNIFQTFLFLFLSLKFFI